MPKISTLSLPQMTDTVNRTFTKKQDEMPMAMKNSGIVIMEDIPHATGDSRILAERVHTDLYASVRDE